MSVIVEEIVSDIINGNGASGSVSEKPKLSGKKRKLPPSPD